MPYSEKTPNIQNPWFFATLGQRILASANAVFDFVSSPVKALPENEAGELMRRYLGHKSWFDSLSASWVETPFYLKAVYIAATVSVSVVIGVFTGNAMLLALSATVLTFTAHLLMVAHETQRLKGAKLFAAEHLDLTKILTQGQEKLDETSKILDAAVERIEKKEAKIDSQIEDLKTEQQRLEQATEKLSVKISEVESQTGQLISQQKEVNQKITDWSGEIQKGTQATVEVTEKVQAVDSSVSQFSQTVDDIEKSQQEFSKAVSEFSMFVKKTPTIETRMYPGLQKFLEADDECDALIAKLNARSVVSYSFQNS